MSILDQEGGSCRSWPSRGVTLRLALVVTIVLAGCLGDPGQKTPPDISDESAAGAGPDEPGDDLANETRPPLPDALWLLEWQDCRLHTISSYASPEDRDATLPENYSASGPASDLLLRIYRCDAVIVDNETVLPASTAAFVMTSVIVDSEVAQASVHESYMALTLNS